MTASKTAAKKRPPKAPQREPKPGDKAARRAFYERIAPLSLAPLWETLHQLVPPAPASPCVPAIWRYAEVRPHLMEAGGLIGAKEAVRRVLILKNPGLGGEAAITRTLFAGLQLILPGEIAPSHRHTQSALRFIVECDGAYTAVDGEKTLMRPGDFVITPSWTWHDHGNDSDRPMVWLDGLDIPMVRMLDAGFAENYPEDTQPLNRPVGDAPARYGAGLLPLGYAAKGRTSPVFNYPYARTREALETMRRAGEWDPCHGLKMTYTNPATGGYAMPTIGSFIQLLPKGFGSAPYRSTDGTVFAVVEGRGRSTVGGKTFDWGPRDVFVAPSWAWIRHEAAGDAVLFSFSDRPVQDALGLWREQRGKR